MKDDGVKDKNVAEMVAAVSDELQRSADRLRKIEGQLLRRLSEVVGSREAMADIQLLDLVIQTIDDLAPFLRVLSKGLSHSDEAALSEMVDLLRLEHLKEDLLNLGEFNDQRSASAPELF